jgi:hypothetical protein
VKCCNTNHTSASSGTTEGLHQRELAKEGGPTYSHCRGGSWQVVAPGCTTEASLQPSAYRPQRYPWAWLLDMADGEE